jgi:hypothetical protein
VIRNLAGIKGTVKGLLRLEDPEGIDGGDELSEVAARQVVPGSGNLEHIASNTHSRLL